MKLVYIPIEVKDRELISKLFFICENISDNYAFFIGDKLSVARAIDLFGKGIYFYKSINHNDTSHINKIKNKGNLYFSIDVEGGALLNDASIFQSFLKYRSSKKNLSLVDKVFTWGDFDHKEWKKKYKKYNDKIIKSGEPRFDMWRKKVYSRIFKDEINSLKKYQPYFFIPSSFYSSYEYLIKAIEFDKKLTKQTTSVPLKKRIKNKRNNYRKFLIFVNLIKKLTKDFPKHRIIIKPHPSENINDWKNKFSDQYRSKIIIDNNFDLTSYIASSKCVIFNESTAGIQSMIMGKKTVCYDIKDTFSMRSYANKCTPRVQSYKKLVNFLNKNYLNKKKNIYLKKIKKRFHITNQTTSKIIFQHFKKNNLEIINLSKIKYKIIIIGLYYLFKDNFYSFLGDVKKKIFKFKINYQSKILKMSGGIERKEVVTIIRNLGLINKTSIINFGKNGYLISKNDAKNS
jgi:surface carbohydrate biosynthesis protein